MKINIRPVALVITLLAGISGNAQEKRNLSLDEAITLSLQNSKEIKLNAAKVNEASAALREARGKRLPDLTVSGSYLRLNQPNVDLKVKLGGQTGSSTTEGGSTGSSSQTPDVNSVTYGMASLSLPLFSGFRIQHGIDAAKYLQKAAALDAENDKDEVVANTIAAYSNLYKAKAALDIVRENLKQSQHRVADLSNLEKNGLLARNDLLKSELQQSNIELALVDAENNWKLTYITMNLMLNQPEEVELIPDADAFTIGNDASNFETWEDRALQNRKDIAAMNMRVKAAGSGVKAAKGEYYPSVALTGAYVAADIPGLVTLTNVVNGGVGVRYSPSSLWKNGAKVAQSKSRLQQAEINREMMNDGIRLQVAQAYQTYLSATKKIDVYNKAVEQANENYRIVKNKYANSLTTTTELLDADVAQLQAQLNYAFAKADVVVAYKKLQTVTGTLNINSNTNK